MTAFEQGYAAYMGGAERESNPFDEEKCPHSRKRWDAGWIRRAIGR